MKVSGGQLISQNVLVRAWYTEGKMNTPLVFIQFFLSSESKYVANCGKLRATHYLDISKHLISINFVDKLTAQLSEVLLKDPLKKSKSNLVL